MNLVSFETCCFPLCFEQPNIVTRLKRLLYSQNTTKNSERPDSSGQRVWKVYWRTIQFGDNCMAKGSYERKYPWQGWSAEKMVMQVLGDHPLKFVLNSRTSISVSGTPKELALMKQSCLSARLVRRSQPYWWFHVNNKTCLITERLIRENLTVKLTFICDLD
jgi:hypothetical protein